MTEKERYGAKDVAHIALMLALAFGIGSIVFEPLSVTWLLISLMFCAPCGLLAGIFVESMEKRAARRGRE